MKVNLKLLCGLLLATCSLIFSETEYMCPDAMTRYPNPVNAPCANPLTIHSQEVGDVPEAGNPNHYESYEPHAGKKRYVDRKRHTDPYRNEMAPVDVEEHLKVEPYFEPGIEQAELEEESFAQTDQD